MRIVRVDPAGVKKLADMMEMNASDLKKAIDTLAAEDALLKRALGENDCTTIRKAIADMQDDYAQIAENMKAVVESMQDYAKTVGEIRFMVNPDGSIGKV